MPLAWGWNAVVVMCSTCISVHHVVHELGRRLSAQLWRVDNFVELLQHIGGALPDELGLESLVWVRQVVRCLQDVLKLGHRRLL